jgi:hypothetical protein
VSIEGGRAAELARQGARPARESPAGRGSILQGREAEAAASFGGREGSVQGVRRIEGIRLLERRRQATETPVPDLLGQDLVRAVLPRVGPEPDAQVGKHRGVEGLEPSRTGQRAQGLAIRDESQEDVLHQPHVSIEARHAGREGGSVSGLVRLREILRRARKREEAIERRAKRWGHGGIGVGVEARLDRFDRVDDRREAGPGGGIAHVRVSFSGCRFIRHGQSRRPG